MENNVYSVEELIKNMLDICKKNNYKEVPITKRELELVLSSLKMEEIYKKEIKELKKYIRNDIEMVNILKALKKGIIYGDREVNVCLQNVEVNDSYDDEIRIYYKLALVDIECGDIYELEDYNKEWFIKGE